MRFLIPLSIRCRLGRWWHDRQSALKKRSLLKRLQGRGTKCNVCGWEGRAFSDDNWHPGTICPECGSQVRHRMLAAALDGFCTVPDLDEKSLLDGKTILHFAPERQLRERIRRAASRYTTADFDRGDCDLKLDISAMPQVADASYDVLIACDVLEHVPDDAAAFREIHRTLKPGGVAILTVPQMDSPSQTEEDPSVKSEPERERRFGQKDHVRMYGDDFPNRLEQAGFVVATVGQFSFSRASLENHVLHPPVTNKNRLATNQRRIYFAKNQPAANLTDRQDNPSD
ncbi:MAG: methyltransferase domain-containing protein [Verrucomicrobiae bacterium]